MKNMRRRIVSIALTGAAVVVSTFGGVAMTAGSASADIKETHEQMFIRLVHEDKVTTKYTDGQLVDLIHEFMYTPKGKINNQTSIVLTDESRAQFVDSIKDPSIGIDSLEAWQIVNDYLQAWDTK